MINMIFSTLGISIACSSDNKDNKPPLFRKQKKDFILVVTILHLASCNNIYATLP